MVNVDILAIHAHDSLSHECIDCPPKELQALLRQSYRSINLCVQQVALLSSATYDPANYFAQADVKVSKVNSAGARPAASSLFRLNSYRDYLSGGTCRQHMQGVLHFELRPLTAKDLTRLVFVSDRRPQVQKRSVI